MNINILDLFESDELHALNELGIDPHDIVFTETHKLPFLKPKQFVCHLRFKEGLYSFDLPEKLPKKFVKRISQTQIKLLSINNSHMRRLMAEAKKNAEFIERFNSELFFKHSFYQGRRITKDELFDFYETNPYYQTVNLSSDADKQPFIALYAMSFYACTVNDLFSVDGIFSMQPERHADNTKKTAGNDVFNLILRNNKEEIEQILFQMGQTLSGIQPLRVNLSDEVMLAKNYTLFVGLSEMGRVFTQVTKNNPSKALEPALTAAGSFMNYGLLVGLCNTISVLSDDDDYRETNAYKKCREVF